MNEDDPNVDDHPTTAGAVAASDPEPGAVAAPVPDRGAEPGAAAAEPVSAAEPAQPGQAAQAAPEAAHACVPDGVLLQHVSDETVLLHLGSGTYYGLDPIGTRMLDLALELPDAEAIVTALEAEYDADRDRLAHDLDHLLGDLVGKGLIVLRNPS